VLTTGGLERATLLLQDLPGVSLKPITLSAEGVDVGQTAIGVSVSASQSQVTGGASIDNYGVSSSGRNRLGATVQAANLLHQGDVLNLGFQTTSQYQNTGLFGVSFPLGYSGLRLGGNISRTVYPLAQVGARGKAVTGDVGLSYPLTRALNGNWNLSLDGYDTLSEATIGDQTAFAPRHLLGMRLGLSANAGDRPMTLGESYWSTSLVLTAGQVSQSLPGADTTGTIGGYTKLALTALDRQVLPGGWYTLVNFRGQVSNTNLDSYEALGVGGSTGVRAYSSEEGSVQEGMLLSVELRRLFELPDGSRLAPGVFFDYLNGYILHTPYAGWQTSLGYANPNQSNHRALAAWGLGVDWVSKHLTAGVTLGWKLPGSADSVSNPGSARWRVLFTLGLTM
jgi:hemolysin activation/secretion protein